MARIKINSLSFVVILIFSLTGAAMAQKDNICVCWSGLNEASRCAITSRLPADIGFSDDETLKIMECLLEQKSNKKNYLGGATHNGVSQTFGPSPGSVIALFRISELFYQSDQFADAQVLLYDGDDLKMNSEKAVNIAYKSY